MNSLISIKIPNVNKSHDMGHDVYDAVLDAESIHRMWQQGLLRIDDEKQRGVNSTTGRQVFKKEKVDRWTEQLLADEHVFGQLTWNYRPEESEIVYDEHERTLELGSGSATLPDSAHRHRAIVQAVESVARGSSFDPKMKFSVRIWRVPSDDESRIFYGMNQEGDKADATRSKFLMQRNIGQRLARDLVRRNSHLGEQNVETVTNSLAAKNPRLMAFNTLAVACEQNFPDVAEADYEELLDFLDRFWSALVEVRPELDVLASHRRQEVRKTLLSGSALAMHGYVGLAMRMHKTGIPLEALAALAPDGPDLEDDFLRIDDPHWQEVGLVTPSTSKTGKTNLGTRNAIQTRRVMAAELVTRVLDHPSAVVGTEAAEAVAA